MREGDWGTGSPTRTPTDDNCYNTVITVLSYQAWVSLRIIHHFIAFLICMVYVGITEVWGPVNIARMAILSIKTII